MTPNAFQKTYTEKDVADFCELIQNLPCPLTGDTSEKLNGTLTATVMSFLVMTHYSKKIVIGSPRALKRANTKALVTSLVLGWWGLPWGIIRTVQSTVINIKNIGKHDAYVPNDHLRNFVISKLAYIETYKDNPYMLSELIKN